ncbi:MAG: hypothetical protein LCH96_18350 [Actinobacteria bacterium]|nr:hypothetical protein [Actinomycetota bacterium]
MTFDEYMAKLTELGGLHNFEVWLSENNLVDHFERVVMDRKASLVETESKSHDVND